MGLGHAGWRKEGWQIDPICLDGWESQSSFLQDYSRDLGQSIFPIGWLDCSIAFFAVGRDLLSSTSHPRTHADEARRE